MFLPRVSPRVPFRAGRPSSQLTVAFGRCLLPKGQLLKRDSEPVPEQFAEKAPKRRKIQLNGIVKLGVWKRGGGGGNLFF